MSGNEEGQAIQSPQEKMDIMFDAWLNGQRLDFANPEAEKTYKDRVLRMKDVVQLKVPDRIPIYANIGFFPAYYAGNGRAGS